MSFGSGGGKRRGRGETCEAVELVEDGEAEDVGGYGGVFDEASAF